ncbi:hypothetical protein ACV229_19830 [Burkholderia sp. MR1-5-21]
MPSTSNRCGERDPHFGVANWPAKRKKNVSGLKRGDLGVLRIQAIRFKDENQRYVSIRNKRLPVRLCIYAEEWPTTGFVGPSFDRAHGVEIGLS